ncbi:MAG: mannose-1-phosphate guanylyltransferase, partial [Planctomycetota bacterium]
DTPKQLLTIFGEQTLLSAAVHRLRPTVDGDATFIATGAHLAARVRELCPDLPAGNVLGEPVPRDSSGAIVLAAAAVQARDPDATLAICTADHLIAPAEEFQRALRTAAATAEREQALATFGITPDRPETGYGYLRRGEPVAPSGADGVAAWRCAAFVEKPDRATAEQYLASGEYLWNSGMFVLPLPVLREALAAHLPAHRAALDALAAGFAGGGLEMVLSQVFEGLPKISFDYGVMEKAERVVLCEAPFSWDDVGAWPALARVHGADDDGNTSTGPVVLHESAGSIGVSDGPLVAGFGLEDHLVVAWGGAVLVCPLDRAADLKALLARLEADGHGATL